MIFSPLALQDCNDGLRHQCHELLFPFGFHRWARTVVLVVVEFECDLLHGAAPVGSWSPP
jgi:hypothetical protein